MPDEAHDLTGKTVLITGASSGIGAAAAKRFAAAGATVLPVGRSPERTRDLAALIGAKPYLADFSHLDQVRDLADDIAHDHPVIDVVAHNAGGTYSDRIDTADGHELTFQTNYLAGFLLNHLLIERILAAESPRVITTTSVGHHWGRLHLDDFDRRRGHFNGVTAYGAAKLADILFVTELTRRYHDRGLIAASFHPGVVGSSFGAQSQAVSWIYHTPLKRVLTISPERGAAPMFELATRSDSDAIAGKYFVKGRPTKPSRAARDPELARRLWTRSEEILGLPATTS